MADCPKRPIRIDHILPAWFKPMPGFRFFDPDGDEVMVLGEGGFRRTNPVKLYAKTINMGGESETLDLGSPCLFQLEMMPWTLVGTYHYKGEWHLLDLASQEQKWWANIKPMTKESD